MHFSGSKLVRRATAAASAITLLASIGASGVLAGGPPQLSFYIDDVRYRTVGTPTNFFGTGAPASTYDHIYNLGTGINVADAKPGDRDFNGGRWQVHQLAFPNGYAAALATGDVNGNGQIDSTAELQLAFDNGTAVDTGVILRTFECTVNKVPASW